MFQCGVESSHSLEQSSGVLLKLEQLFSDVGVGPSIIQSARGEDRRGLYADVMQAISQSGTNVKAAELSTKDGTVFSTIVVEVDNRTHLAKVIKSIRKVRGITDVERREGPTPNS